jgi:hypothetical protein
VACMKWLLAFFIALAMPLVAVDFKALDHNCSISVPEAWEQVNNEMAPGSVKLILRGKGDYELPPTMNVAVEPVAATMSIDQYVECVQTLHRSNPLHRCSHLGQLPGGREKMELMQLQLDSQWGPVEMLQGLLVRDQVAYVVTVSARQEEFGKQLPTFIKTLQSFTTAVR